MESLIVALAEPGASVAKYGNAGIAHSPVVKDLSAVTLTEPSKAVHCSVLLVPGSGSALHCVVVHEISTEYPSLKEMMSAFGTAFAGHLSDE